MSPRRKRRSAEVRNSLRLFGLLAVLAGVNVYVFFFNRGTAPREVLKPSSTFKAADGANGKVATLKAASDEAKAQVAGPSAAALPVPAPTKAKVRPPVPVASAPATTHTGSARTSGKTATKVGTTPGLASGTATPKRSSRGEPGAGQRQAPARQRSGKQSRKDVR